MELIYVLIELMLVFVEDTQPSVASVYSATFRPCENGTVTNPSYLPYCDEGQIIRLLDYSFSVKTCEDKCPYQSVPLSAESKMILYEGCSLKQECENLCFHQVAGKVDSITITYVCLETETIYEMCSETEEKTTTPVQLYVRHTTRQHCQCRLSGPNDFKVRVNDLRLYAIDGNERKCSKSTIQIGETSFSCNETSFAYGSVFNVAIPQGDIHNETITVNLQIDDPNFQMVWISVETNDPLSMKCTVPVAEEESTSVKPENRTLTSGDNTENKHKEDSLLLIGTIVLLVMIVICSLLCIVKFFYRKRREIFIAQQDAFSVTLLTACITVDPKSHDNTNRTEYGRETEDTSLKENTCSPLRGDLKFWRNGRWEKAK